MGQPGMFFKQWLEKARVRAEPAINTAGPSCIMTARVASDKAIYMAEPEGEGQGHIFLPESEEEAGTEYFWTII